MNFLRNHKNICSVVAALMVAVLVVYSYGSFRSYAAAPEVSTLPADIDIDVDYTADTVNFSYAGKAYSIDRKHKVNLTHYRYSSNRYVLDGNCPEFFEYRFDGYSCYTSYWFSPSEMRVYVLIGWHSYSKVKSYLPSPKYGTFRISESDSDVYYYMTTIDYGSGSAIYNKMSSKEAIDYWDAQVSSYDDSHNRSCDDVYACKSNNSSFNYYNTGFLEDGFLVRTYMDYKASGELNTYDYASNYHYIPNDLLCIFSNYEISGFYEPDTSKVHTPDYYFNFQYIFYKEGYGYIFVDSAKRCKMVGFPNGVTRPRFYFDGEGNNYVYSSVDGISWILKSDYNTMYNSYFELPCNHEFTDYTLVYTNDKSFGGDPLVTPSYGNITDVTDNLNSFLNDYNIISTSGRGGSLNSFDYAVVEYPENNSFFGAFMGTLTMKSVKYCVYENITSKGSGRFSDYIHVYYFASDAAPYITIDYPTDSSGITAKDPLINLIYSNSSLADCTYSLLSTTEVPTLSMYLRLLNNATLNIDTKLSALRTDLHADLKSIFTNITLTNQYLKLISDNLGSLSIPAAAPDYSGNFDKLSAALDKLHYDLIYEEGVTKLPNVPQYLVYIYGVTKDIRTKLDNINVQLSDDIVTFRKAVISRFDPVIEKLDSIIEKIPSSSGGSFDDSNMVGSIVSLKADISDNFTTLIKLLKNDTDGVENIADLTSFLTTYVVSMGNAAYFTTLLEFADGVKNNVTLINETMVTMVTDSGIFAPIFTLGAGFAVFSGLIRKERMD